MLAEIDDAAEPKLLRVADFAAPHIFNGFYTVTFPCGSRRTFKISTCRKGSFAGKRLLGMLIGPDNTADYEPFAFLEDDGFKVWRRFVNQRQAEYAKLLWNMMNGEVIEGHDYTLSKRCLVCGRTLTDPISNELGIGPTCRGK